MIASINIKDFQSHADTTINFAPDGELTVIVGPSDSGKTAAFRALRWVAYNEPAGIDYIRVGTSKARVSINMADGRTVIRERSKSMNRYTIISGEDDQILEGFGTSVPLEVQQVLGIVPVQIGEAELNLNLAEQLDGPFLGKSVPPTQKAKVLGKLAGTEEVDLASKHLGTDLYRRRQDEKRLRQDVADLGELIGHYDYLESLGEAIDTVSGLLVSVKADDARKTRLEQLRTELQALNTQIQTVEKRASILSIALVSIGPLVARTDRSADRHRRLVDVSGRLFQVDAGLHSVLVKLYLTRDVDFLATLVQNIGVLIPEVARMIALRDQLGSVDGQLKTANETIWSTAAAEDLHRSLWGSDVDATTLRRLRKLQADLQAIEPNLQRAWYVLVATASVDETAALTSQTSQHATLLGQLKILKFQLGTVEWSQSQAHDKVTALGAAIDQAETLVAETRSLVQVAVVRNRLYDAELELSANVIVSTDAERGLAAAQKEYGDILQAMGTCPTCGVDTKKIQLREVV